MKREEIISICIICEGYEELDYITRLKDLHVFSSRYSITTVNAKGITRIFPQYQSKFSSGRYDLVLVFCDTDKGPSENYLELKMKTNKLHGSDVADQVVIFGNPCTLQIILSHFEYLKINSPNKKKNADLIKKYTGIEKYDATDEQRKKLFEKINKDNYGFMKQNIRRLSDDDMQLSSTNFLKFANNLESSNKKWIDDITKNIC